MNLLSLAESVTTWEATPIRLEAGRCLHARDRSATCDACVRICPTQALQLNSSIMLNAQVCVACGACLSACPTGAFEGDDGVADLLNCAARLESVHTIEIACAQLPAPEKGSADIEAVIRTATCLAALGPSAYLGLMTLGLQRIYVRLDACATCPIGQVTARIAEAIAQAEQLLGSYGLTDRIVELTVIDAGDDRPVYEAKHPPLSRRGLFQLFAVKGPRQINRMLTDEGDPGIPAKALPAERRRLINALRRLPAADTSQPLVDLSFARMTVDEKCTACGACARICPTGALAFNAGEDDTYQLSFVDWACLDCGVCLKICRPAALHRADTTLGNVLNNRAISLQAGRLRSCPKCGAKFSAESGGELCSVCKLRRMDPSGRFAPPGPGKNKT